MIYVLGANGFVGSKICSYLYDFDEPFQAVTRLGNSNHKYEEICLSQFMMILKTKKVKKSSIIINAIGTAHLKTKQIKRDPNIFNYANVEICENIAKLAKLAKIKKFIQISSIGVIGNNCNFKINDKTLAAPVDIYAKSKRMAEIILEKMFHNSFTQLIILRPTLVYGINAKGNFKLLMNLIKIPIPLPFGQFRNKKSFISDRNLGSFVLFVTKLKKSGNLIANISDPDTSELLTFMLNIAKGLGRKPLVINIPLSVLFFFFIIIGRQNMFKKLNENLEVDMSQWINYYNWIPAETQYEALQRITSKTNEF